jgi:hypothetical protein
MDLEFQLVGQYADFFSHLSNWFLYPKPEQFQYQKEPGEQASILWE